MTREQTSPTGNEDRVRRDWPALSVVLFLCLLGGTALLTARTYQRPGVDQSPMEGMADFHNAIYFPTVAYFNQISPYHDEYARLYPVNRPLCLYSPLSFVLHAPWAALPLPAADWAYFAAMGVMVIALAWLSLRANSLSTAPFSVFAVAAILLASRPAHTNLKLGQITLQIVLPFLAAVHFGRSRPWLAACATALVTIKPTFVVPLVWFLIVRGQFFPAFAGVAMGAVAAAILTLPLVLSQGAGVFFPSLLATLNKHDSDPVVAPISSWTRVDANIVVSRLFNFNPETAWALGVAAVVLLFAGWTVHRLARREASLGVNSLTGLVICTATLTCVYHCTYDLLLLATSAVWLTSGARHTLSSGERRTALGLVLFLAFNYLSSRTALDAMGANDLGFDSPGWRLATALNATALLTLFAIACGAAWRAPHREAAYATTRQVAAPLELGV
ncbi:MAG: DUF2029 domain-containing protein [Planctomycetales bacterium]|nr:DUF2029 domain-containing protein [Planctomycetales bacterium]